MYNFLQEVKSDQNLLHNLNQQNIDWSFSDWYPYPVPA